MLKEFKDFVARANVIDLAVAVIIGAAFGKNSYLAGRRDHHATHRFDARQG
jgi:hypothetical protein